jgi:mevalonate kinase
VRRERNTLVGTPTVIAPEAIFLVGEFGLPEEQVAVLAALSSHATAQYCPDVVAPSLLVAAVVERAHDHLGEAATALPPGSVLLSPAQPQDGDGHAFDTTPAIAVAAAAAVFEAAGQSIRKRKDEILVVAEAAHRATHPGIGAEGELAAALHGGLIKVVFQPQAAPRIEALAPPAGLHLVVFQTGCALFPADWLASVHQFADRYPIAYAQIIKDLLERAGRFAAELSEGNATAAVVSAGRYGDCIVQLAAAVSAPMQSAPLLQAMELAKAIGGIAKTTRVAHRDLGIAIFATPEAASLFARACQPPLVPLYLDLDRGGVRQILAPTGESAEIHTPWPETDPSSISSEAIVRGFLDDASTERTLSELDPDLPASRRRHPGQAFSSRWR